MSYRFLLRASLPLLLCQAAYAQDTARVVIERPGSAPREITLTAPEQMETVVREFLGEPIDGVLTITTALSAGQEERILWAQKVGDNVRFEPEGNHWIPVPEALERFRGANASLHLSACQRHLEHLGEAVHQYAEQHNGALPQTLSDLIPAQLESLPSCPTAPSESYASTYKVRPGQRFLLHCPGNHDVAGVPLTFPAYDSVEGVRFP